MASLGFSTTGQFQINGVPRAFGSYNAYNLINGGLSLANSVITNGFATTLYTGNGTTQSVVTGVDMATQWGNSATETFGGLVWGKSRSYSNSHNLCDTIRGVGNFVSTDLTNAQFTVANRITSFNSNGFSLGTDNGLNTNLATYASWVFQTTHRITGTTNHGKLYTCHYNPFTGFTIVKYEGSGLAGHEIPHHLGRKLGFFTIKNLLAAENWYAQWKDGSYLELNTTLADTSFAGPNVTENAVSINVRNTSAQQYIMYGWANSYFDESNTLIGNYEVGVYQGTGAAGNKVTTRGKPAWVMIKRLDSTEQWSIVDNMRDSFDSNLFANLPNAEEVGNANIVGNSDGFTVMNTETRYNASGGQYLYMVVYDNDSGSGKSKYPRATDTSTLNLNATIPFANGIDASGVKNTILSKNETVSGLTFTEGKNYVYSKNDGTYGVTPHAPRYGDYVTRNYAGENPSIYRPSENLWYNSTIGAELVTNPNFDTDILNTTLISYNGSVYVSDATSWAWSSGRALGTASTGKIYVGIEKSYTTVIGKKYKAKVNISQNSASGATLIASTATVVGAAGAALTSVGYITGLTVGSYEFEFMAQSTTTYLLLSSSATAGQTIQIDSISSFEAVIEPTTEITESRNYLNAVVYADANGQPTYVQQLPKTEYKDIVKANEYQGKNACTAWVNFDGTTTPPTIRDSFNVKAVIRTATGMYDIYFKEPMDTVDYVPHGTPEAVPSETRLTAGRTVSKFRIEFYGSSGTAVSCVAGISVFGGKR